MAPLPRLNAVSHTTTEGSRGARIWSQTWRVVVCWIFGFVMWVALVAMLEASSPGYLERNTNSAVALFVMLDLVVMVVATPLIIWRHRWPMTIMLVLIAISVVSGTLMPAALAATMAVATRRRWRDIAIGAAAWAINLVLNDILIAPLVDPTQGSSLGRVPDAIFLIGGTALLYALAVSIGWNRGAKAALLDSYREAAESARREQLARVGQAQAAERTRIAREMHDVLAHKISLISLHSGVLAYQDDLSADEMRETAGVIRATAHQALEELREVLGVLRDEDTHPAAPPQPTLFDLPAMVAQEEGAGADITLAVAPGFWDRAASLATSTSRHAQRIVQEALTNARKHASGQPVAVEVGGDETSGLRIVVTSRLGLSGGVPGAGMGLTGLRERAALAGGRLDAGARGDRFVVEADLPWRTPGGGDE